MNPLAKASFCREGSLLSRRCTGSRPKSMYQCLCVRVQLQGHTGMDHRRYLLACSSLAGCSVLSQWRTRCTDQTCSVLQKVHAEDYMGFFPWRAQGVPPGCPRKAAGSKPPCNASVRVQSSLASVRRPAGSLGLPEPCLTSRMRTRKSIHYREPSHPEKNQGHLIVRYNSRSGLDGNHGQQ